MDSQFQVVLPNFLCLIYNGLSMVPKANPDEVLACASELEREFLRIGAEKCNRLEDHSQLSAFLRLGLRATSLLRGMAPLLTQETLDSFQAVHRAFMEAWMLQFEFRLIDSTDRVARWFGRKNDSWVPNPKKVSNEIEGLGLSQSPFGREWEELSELTHPTLDATTNSCAVATLRWGLTSKPEELTVALEEMSS